MRAFNDWLTDFCSLAPNRLFGVAMIPTDTVGPASTESAAAKMGMRGAMISITQDAKHGYDRGALGADMGRPRRSRHADQPARRGEHEAFRPPAMSWPTSSCAFTPTMYTVAGMIFSGLFDRHPS